MLSYVCQDRERERETLWISNTQALNCLMPVLWIHVRSGRRRHRVRMSDVRFFLALSSSKLPSVAFVEQMRDSSLLGEFIKSWAGFSSRISIYHQMYDACHHRSPWNGYLYACFACDREWVAAEIVCDVCRPRFPAESAYRIEISQNPESYLFNFVCVFCIKILKTRTKLLLRTSVSSQFQLNSSHCN